MRVSLSVLLLLLAVCLALPAQAQTPATAAIPAAPAVAVAPPETREVVVEGRAAIGTGGVPGAREAAVAQALRAAVEKATGVFVSARTLTSNYRLVQDEVTTRAEGFATLGEILRERVLPGEVRVTIRATVSLRPLAKRLRELKLTRAWRVHVASGELATATLERTLGEAGFVIVSRPEDADLSVRVSPEFTTVQEMSLETAAGPMTLHSVRGALGLRVLRTGTDEVVAALSGAQVIAHIDRATARAEAAERVLAVLAPRLADALMLLPAQPSQPVTLVVANLPRITEVGRLHDALRMLPGVRQATRRSWAKGVATWELDVTADAVPLLARALEEDAVVRPFGLSVSSETRARITASAAAPNRPSSR